jgi:hypothetical protein
MHRGFDPVGAAAYAMWLVRSRHLASFRYDAEFGPLSAQERKFTGRCFAMARCLLGGLGRLMATILAPPLCS